MYYVNQEQIEQRLAFIPDLKLALEELRALRSERPLVRLEKLAQERALHLAIEIVTDIGSLMIDGFIMRDASSYEDIIDILHGEGVFADSTAEPLSRLVKLRKPLVQHYMELNDTELEAFAQQLPEVLGQFAEEIRHYLNRHL